MTKDTGGIKDRVIFRMSENLGLIPLPSLDTGSNRILCGFRHFYRLVDAKLKNKKSSWLPGTDNQFFILNYGGKIHVT